MLKVLKPGFFTTVQDQGRFGHRNQGVPISGTMDRYSADTVNRLLENDPQNAVLEITMTGPRLEFGEDTYICTGGAAFGLTLNDDPIDNFAVVKVRKGDVLTYGRLLSGFRAYLGIKGGFKTEAILGSRSQYVPLTKQRAIAKDDCLDYEKTTDFAPKIPNAQIDTTFNTVDLHVEKGPEYDLLTQDQQGQLLGNLFTISKENNRMAYQLVETIPAHSHSILTSFTMPGTVQLAPSGRLMILMKDGQTTGGYPRVLQLSDRAIDILAQKRTGDTLCFRLD